MQKTAFDHTTPLFRMDGSRVDSHKQSYYLQIYDIQGAQAQIYWNKCACNEADALLRRHCIPRLPNFDVKNQALMRLREKMENFGDRMKLLVESRSSLKSVVLSSRPNIRGRYKRAYRDLVYKRIDVGEKEATAKAFVKFEKIPETKFLDGKAPRLIQYRSFDYLLLLKSCIKPFSDAIKTKEIRHSNGQLYGDIYTKTKVPTEVARLMKEAWDEFIHPVGVCADHAKFDGHYAEQLLEAEHAMWLRMMFSKLLKKLLNLQINNKGYTQNGIRYRVKGTRLSGEYTTSDGNTTTNIFMITQWLEDSGVSKYKLFVNGDDSVIIMEYSDYLKCLPFEYFANFNMETELEALAFDFRQIKYCQTSPIRVGGVWKMIKDPVRTLSRMSYADSKYANCRARYSLGINLCELAVSSGVPILQSFCLRNMSVNTKPLGSVDKYPAKVASQHSLLIQHISDETRGDFEVAFGISKNQQIRFEMEMAGETNELAFINLKKYKDFHLN